jgi:hypothetical protein
VLARPSQSLWQIAYFDSRSFQPLPYVLEAANLFLSVFLSIVYPGVEVALIVCCAVKWISVRAATESDWLSPRLFSNGTRICFVEAYRAMGMVLACVCILGVDLAPFPRSMAKTETYGVSLMDLAVGSMMFSAGIVHKVPLPHDLPRHYVLYVPCSGFVVRRSVPSGAPRREKPSIAS